MANYRMFNPFILLSGTEPPDDDDFGGGEDPGPIVGGFTGIGQDPGANNGGNGTNSFADWSLMNDGSSDFEAYRAWFMSLYADDPVNGNNEWLLLNPEAGLLFPEE